MNIDTIEDTNIRRYKAYVQSESREGGYYLVEMDGDKWTCSCPAGKNRGKCKHIDACS